MNKTILTIILTISMLIFSACTSQAEPSESLQNPNVDEIKDLKITLKRTGMYTMVDLSIQEITITSKGFETKYSHFDGTPTKSEFKEFENNEFEELIKLFDNNNFETLKSEYNSKANVADVGEGLITYKGKSITIKPYVTKQNPVEIKNIINGLNKILNKQNDNVLEKPINQHPESTIHMLTYNGVQCEETPWDKWYKTGEVQFFAKPNQKDLITTYYSTKFNINIEHIEEVSNGIVCEACAICPAYNYYEIELDLSEDIDELLKQGWLISN